MQKHRGPAHVRLDAVWIREIWPSGCLQSSAELKQIAARIKLYAGFDFDSGEPQIAHEKRTQ